MLLGWLAGDNSRCTRMDTAERVIKRSVSGFRLVAVVNRLPLQFGAKFKKKINAQEKQTVSAGRSNDI